MTDEEDDYMSEKFLTSTVEVRPSLIHSRAKKRQLEVEKKREEDGKRQREERLSRTGKQSNDQLQEALKKPIEASNKGFQLLAKMGYTPGQSLGKNNSAATNVRTEPINIAIKNDRGGLGREQALLELAEKRRQLRLQHLQRKAANAEVLTADEYRRRATQKAEERFMQGALRRCQLSCKNLDEKADVKTPELLWFWPEEVIAPDEETATEHGEKEMQEEQDDDDYTTPEKLELLTNYLRCSYKFCFWCGVEYTDQQDLSDNCPGLTRDEH